LLIVSVYLLIGISIAYPIVIFRFPRGNNNIATIIYFNNTIKSKDKRGRKWIVAVGIAGLAGVIITTMVSLAFMAQSVNTSNPVFFQSMILVLNAVIVVGITVASARWIYGKL
jgi:hypothetical protein